MKNKAEIQTFLAFFCQFLLSFTVNHITHAKSSTHAVSFELITSLSPHPVETKLTLVPSSELPTPPHSDHDSGPPPQDASRLTLLLRPFVYQFPHHDVQTIPPPPSCVTFGRVGGRRQRGPFRVCCGVNLHIDKLVCRSDFTSALPHAPWRNAVRQKFNLLLQEPPFLCPPTTPPVNLWTPHSLLNILYIFARELSHSRG